MKASYGIGAVGKDMVYALTASYVLYYYNVVLGLDEVFIGIILLIARIFDALNDPMMGVVVAKTRTRWGRFRPWLFTGTVLNAVVLFALFAVPAGTKGTGLMIYFTAIYILWGVTYTVMDIPYWSMIPAIAKNSKERESMSVVGRTCAGVGSAIVTILTMKAVSFFGGGSTMTDYREGFRIFALCISVFFIFATVITCLFVKENTEADMQTTSVGKMFRALFHNDQAIIVVIALVLINTSLYITSNLLIYFFQFDVAGADWEGNYALFNTFGGGMQIVSMMVFFPLLRKFIKKKTLFLSAIGSAVLGYMILLVLSLNNLTAIWQLFIPAFFIFAANGILTVLLTVFLADSVDYGELKNHRRDESVIFSMQTFVVKFASGISALIASIGLAVVNLDTSETAVTQTAESVMGLRLIMAITPVAGLIAAFFIIRKKYLLTEQKLDEISAKLKAEREIRERA